MSFSQADRFEQQVTNQLSKWLGAVPVLMPIFRCLRVAEIVDRHSPGKEDVSRGTSVVTLGLNRLMAPKPLYKVNEWIAKTVLEDALDVSAEQMHDVRLGRTLDDIYPHLSAIWQTWLSRLCLSTMSISGFFTTTSAQSTLRASTRRAIRSTTGTAGIIGLMPSRSIWR